MMKVTLRKFLEIVGGTLIVPSICQVIVAEGDDVYVGHNGDWLNDMEKLEPYLEYEITKFSQFFAFGELDKQIMCLEEMEE